MAQVLVIADDLTGANATGVLLKKNGFDTYTVLDAANGTDIQAPTAPWRTATAWWCPPKAAPSTPRRPTRG